jgi:2-hydroxychromene-2-carboxylate isomerase
MASGLDAPADAAFYFDLHSPEAYLVAECVLGLLRPPVAWQPVLARGLPGADSFDVYRCAEERNIRRGELQRRAATMGLPAIVWPDPFPFDSEPAMRVALYAQGIGRVVAFSQAAFRHAFAAGNSLTETDNILIAAAGCEMHPRAVLGALERPALGEQLLQGTQRAASLGVRDVPALRIGDRVFHGADALETAAGAQAGAQ